MFPTFGSRILARRGRVLSRGVLRYSSDHRGRGEDGGRPHDVELGGPHRHNDDKDNEENCETNENVAEHRDSSLRNLKKLLKVRESEFHDGGQCILE